MTGIPSNASEHNENNAPSGRFRRNRHKSPISWHPALVYQYSAQCVTAPWDKLCIGVDISTQQSASVTRKESEETEGTYSQKSLRKHAAWSVARTAFSPALASMKAGLPTGCLK
jgi:hypothetical protein